MGFEVREDLTQKKAYIEPGKANRKQFVQDGAETVLDLHVKDKNIM